MPWSPYARHALRHSHFYHDSTNGSVWKYFFLYQYYKDTHANVAPLTVNRSTFIKDAPTKTGFYSLNRNNRIENLVFTENNEIAYVCSLNRQSYQPFIQTVLNEIFSKFDEIFFEAEDTDWAASILLNQFKFNKNESFNTYIYS